MITYISFSLAFKKSYKSYCKGQRLHGSPKPIATAPSSKRACNKELALLVEVAAVSPLPTRSQCTPKSYLLFRGPR